MACNIVTRWLLDTGTEGEDGVHDTAQLGRAHLVDVYGYRSTVAARADTVC